MSDQAGRKDRVPGRLAAFFGLRESVDAATAKIGHRAAKFLGPLEILRGGERQVSSAAVAKSERLKLVHAGQTLPSKDLFAYRPNLPTAEDCKLSRYRAVHEARTSTTPRTHTQPYRFPVMEFMRHQSTELKDEKFGPIIELFSADSLFFLTGILLSRKRKTDVGEFFEAVNECY